MKKRITVPLFTHLTVILYQEDDLSNVINHYDLVAPTNTLALTSFVEGDNIIMAFAYGNTTPGIISHECLHAVNFICESIGMKHDIYNDEVQAYLLQHLVNKCFNLLKIDL